MISHEFAGGVGSDLLCLLGGTTCCAAAGDKELKQEGRTLITDHGHYVVVNVYAPNAGQRPERSRLKFKLQWFAALRAKLDHFAGKGKQILLVGDLNIPRSKADVSREIRWEGLYTAEVLLPTWN
jgi:exonuclease III